MNPDNCLFFAAPVTPRAALVSLPKRREMTASGVIVVLMSGFALASMTATPSLQFADLDTRYHAVFAAVLFGAAAGGLGYFYATRTCGRSWPFRVLFSGISALITTVLVAGYVQVV